MERKNLYIDKQNQLSKKARAYYDFLLRQLKPDESQLIENLFLQCPDIEHKDFEEIMTELAEYGFVIKKQTKNLESYNLVDEYLLLSSI